MIFVNYKTYEQGSGENALKLTKVLEEVAQEKKIKIIPVVQALDAKEIVSSTTLSVWLQHIDPIDFGAYTGWILPDEVSKIGVAGVFLNHSEHKFESFDLLKKACESAKDAGLDTLIFAASLEELEAIGKLKPTYVAYEPPELVGSTTTSVAQAKPEVIEKAAQLARDEGIPLIVGAGIHSRDDIKKSLSLGAAGFAIATNIVKAENPRKELLNLIEGYN